MLLKFGFSNASKIGKTFDVEKDIQKLVDAIQEAEVILDSAKKGPSKVI